MCQQGGHYKPNTAVKEWEILAKANACACLKLSDIDKILFQGVILMLRRVKMQYTAVYNNVIVKAQYHIIEPVKNPTPHTY